MKVKLTGLHEGDLGDVTPPEGVGWLLLLLWRAGHSDEIEMIKPEILRSPLTDLTTALWTAEKRRTIIRVIISMERIILHVDTGLSIGGAGRDEEHKEENCLMEISCPSVSLVWQYINLSFYVLYHLMAQIIYLERVREPGD